MIIAAMQITKLNFENKNIEIGMILMGFEKTKSSFSDQQLNFHYKKIKNEQCTCRFSMRAADSASLIPQVAKIKSTRFNSNFVCVFQNDA